MDGNSVNEEAGNLEEVINLALRLSPVDRVRLLERLVPIIKEDVQVAKPKPRQSLLGLCADLGPAPSAKEIDEARREAWGRF